jgi:hypothetical protein
VGRRAGGDETYLPEIGKLKHFLGKPQMPIMNRIKCAAQNPDRFFAH